MNRTVLALPVAVLAVMIAAPAAQQTAKPPAPSSFVLGRAVDATTNQPIGSATVVLTASGSARGPAAALSVLTTDDGFFLFRGLAAGSYVIAATAAGYLPGGHGQRRPGGSTQPFTLADGERAGNLTVKLWREATLSGTIRDDAGDPVPGVSVTLLTRAQLAGASPSRTALSEPAPTAFADLAGVYRFTGLLPGEYIVSIPMRMTQLPIAIANFGQGELDGLRASGLISLTSGLRSLGPAVRLGDVLIQTSAEGPWASRLQPTLRADGAVSAYASTFFPGVPHPSQATTIELSSGDDRDGINFQLKPSVLGRVTGRVTGPSGPVAGLAVHLIPAFANNSQFERSHQAAVTVSAAGGAFAFLAVPPGEYVLKAWRLPPSLVIGSDALPAEPTLWASHPITVTDRQATNTEVVLTPGSSIRGRVVLDGTAAPLPPASFQTTLSVAFEPSWSLAFGARLSVRVAPAFDFVTHGLPPGKYHPLLPNQFSPEARGWFFESVTKAGRDLLIDPIVLESGADATDVLITFSDKRTRITGTVLDSAGKPFPAAAVVMFPANVRAWTTHGMPPVASWAVAVSQTGSFGFDVRPGEYLIAALDEARLADWRREPVVAVLAARAAKVTIARGDTARVDLKLLIPVREPLR